MAFFNFNKKKNNDTLDLSEDYFKKQRQDRIKEIKSKENLEETQRNNQESYKNESPFGFFDSSSGYRDLTNNSKSENDSNILDLSKNSGETLSAEEKRRRLAKRLLDITSRLEDLSNQIYHLQQRVEFLERKNERE